MSPKAIHLLLALLILSVLSHAQEPTSRPAAAGQEPAVAPAPAAPKAERAPDPVLAAWIDELGRRLTANHPRIRRSAAAALGALGKDAAPKLRELTSSADPAVARVARRLLERAERPQQRRRRGQNRATPADPKTLAAELGRNLKLGPDVVTKLERTLKEAHARRQELTQQRQDGELDRPGFAAAAREARADLEKELGEYLTPEQSKKVMRRATSGNRGKGRRPRGRRQKGADPQDL